MNDPHRDVSQDDDDRNDVDAQFLALMEGLRTSLPGVQVLFAFLLTAPLQAEFSALDRTERVAFSVAFYAAGLASILLIAPSVHQRLRAPKTGLVRRSQQHLIWATWVSIVGTLVMGVALLATIFLVSGIVFDVWRAIVTTTLIGGALCWSWLFLPLVTFARRR